MLLFLASVPALYQAANTDQVDFNKYDIDSPVKDLMWCGTNNEFILVLSEKGSIYRSRDRGLTWRKLQSALSLSGQKVADSDQEVIKHACQHSLDWYSTADDAKPRG
jgi:hypothetical protein